MTYRNLYDFLFIQIMICIIQLPMYNMGNARRASHGSCPATTAWFRRKRPPAHVADASKMVAMKKTQKTVEKHREHLLFHNRLGY